MKHADPNEVGDFAAELPNAFLECRDLGHEWRHWMGKREGKHVRRHIRCARCLATKWQLLSQSGEILGSSSAYPPGYLTKGMGRIVAEGRNILRVESMRRELPDG